MTDFLRTPIEYLKGVGPERANLLKTELGIFTFEDLLLYFPFRHVDKSAFHKVREIDPNMPAVQLKGQIQSVQEVRQKRGSRLVAKFADETGVLELVWFKGAKWIKPTLKGGVDLVVYGKPNLYGSGLNIAHPEIEKWEDFQKGLSKSLQPVYSSTEKASNKGLNSKGIEKIQRNLVSQMKAPFVETLSPMILDQLRLIDKNSAVINLHFPENHDLLRKAQTRLKFEELFFVQLGLLRMKIDHQREIQGFVFDKVGDHFNNFYSNHLPFELTNAQKRVIKEIRADLGSGRHMNRLLQGDVGSGKTIVALLIMLMALDNNFQACLMAPTEILANQHFEGLSELLENTGVAVALLTGSTKTADRKTLHEQLENGELNILIGTHALLEDKVKFHNLGLVIIDEQHRFGVAQRAKLWKKGSPSLILPKGKELERMHYKYQTARPSTYGLLKEFQRERKKHTTEPEQVLWEQLRAKNLGYKFRRQHVIDMFIVDFVCIRKRLVVEVDGKYHLKSEQIEADEMRTQILNELGFKVIRFTNEDIVGNIDHVLDRLRNKLESLPDGEGGGAIIPPHVLVMTATPIPRTLAMTFYGDLDVSVIDELPPGRKPIQTIHKFDSHRLAVWGFVKKEIEKGRQVYIVYPLIKESEKLDYKDLMDGYESVKRDFPDQQISIVHGQMKAEDKDYEMQRFLKKQTLIMVATTVIEVGVNVPNASVMIIESAERFGLSQLHQLRGRVGRGAEQSYCLLVTSYKLSSDAKTRMETMVRTNDGFEISEVDLKLRGPGDLVGTQQSGMLDLKVADLVRDGQILQLARNTANVLLDEDPDFQKPENQAILREYNRQQKYRVNWGRIS